MEKNLKSQVYRLITEQDFIKQEFLLINRDSFTGFCHVMKKRWLVLAVPSWHILRLANPSTGEKSLQDLFPY